MEKYSVPGITVFIINPYENCQSQSWGTTLYVHTNLHPF